MTPTALRNLWKKENLKYGTGGDALWVSGTWRWLGQGPHTPRPMRGQLASIFRPIRWQENRSQKCRCFSQPPKLSTPSQIITIMCLTLLVTSLNLFFMDSNFHFSNESKSDNIASNSKMGRKGRPKRLRFLIFTDHVFLRRQVFCLCIFSFFAPDVPLSLSANSGTFFI